MGTISGHCYQWDQERLKDLDGTKFCIKFYDHKIILSLGFITHKFNGFIVSRNACFSHVNSTVQ